MRFYEGVAAMILLHVQNVEESVEFLEVETGGPADQLSHQQFAGCVGNQTVQYSRS